MAKFEPVRFEDSKPLMLAGLKAHYTPDTMQNIPDHWERFRPFMGNVPTQVDAKTYGVCYNVSGGEFDYLTGVEVSKTSELPDELTFIRIPSQKYAVFVHREHISKIKDTIDAIGKEWLPSAGVVPTGDPTFFERYENYDPATGTGDIQIWVPVTSR
ncbi:MAG TPA: GyrI-like domain-containing protein [Pyrinomonadaceae bacterium]|nr:GyrI-like domain-containing protein [Pyrinomonadaceae bacterium]